VSPLLISELWFSLAATTAVLIVGIAKGGLGVVAVPLMSMFVSPARAAAIMLPVLMVMDALALRVYWRLQRLLAASARRRSSTSTPATKAITRCPMCSLARGPRKRRAGRGRRLSLRLRASGFRRSGQLLPLPWEGSGSN